MSTGAATAASVDTVVSYGFEPAMTPDAGAQGVLTNAGSASVTTSVVSAHGGTVDTVASWSGQGSAVRFPAYNPTSSGARAVIKVVNRTSTDVLAPGNRDFSWSADFALDADSESHARGSYDNGNNIFQRGLFGDTQFKLDADGRQPSCRLRGSTGTQGALRVQAPVTVAAGQWYHATCTRTGNTLSIAVQAIAADGSVPGQWSRSATSSRGFGTLTWSKTGTPLTIGGKLSAAGKLTSGSTDQFNGVVDNAVLQFQNG
jgi:hypothetical protein